MAGAPYVGVPYEDYTWASIDQRMPDAPAPYDLHYMVQLEAEYQKVNYGKRMVPVKIEGLVFTVDLGTMRQINAQGKHRKVVRMPAEKPAWAGRGGYSSTKPTVTSPTSAASAAVVWYSVDPTDGCRDEYARRDALALEDALQKLKSGGSPSVVLAIGSWNFTVNVREMRQYNSKGQYRKVVRNVAAAVGGPTKKTATPVAALPRPQPAATSPTTPVPSPLVSNPSYVASPSVGTPASVSSLVGNIDFSSPTWDSGEYDGHGAVFSPCGSTCPSMSPSGSNAPSPTHAGTDPLLRYKKVLEVVAGVEPIVEVVQGKPLDTAAAALLRDIPTAYFSEAESLYGEILAEIKRERWVREKFGAANLTRHDEELFGIPVGAKVPNYYANVVSETIYRRKVLSLLGLRNLVRNGARIFSDMQRTLFAGDTSLYKNGEGLMLMRHLTGNTVDLDEVVLRCDKDTLKHINTSNRNEGKAVFSSLAEFARSSQAQRIALSSARNVLGLFSTKLGLTSDQRKRRKVFLADGDYSIPRAAGCNDRGKHAAWMVWFPLASFVLHTRTHSIPLTAPLPSTPTHRTCPMSLGRCCWLLGTQSRVCEGTQDAVRHTRTHTHTHTQLTAYSAHVSTVTSCGRRRASSTRTASTTAASTGSGRASNGSCRTWQSMSRVSNPRHDSMRTQRVDVAASHREVRAGQPESADGGGRPVRR